MLHLSGLHAIETWSRRNWSCSCQILPSSIGYTYSYSVSAGTQQMSLQVLKSDVLSTICYHEQCQVRKTILPRMKNFSCIMCAPILQYRLKALWPYIWFWTRYRLQHIHREVFWLCIIIVKIGCRCDTLQQQRCSTNTHSFRYALCIFDSKIIQFRNVWKCWNQVYWCITWSCSESLLINYTEANWEDCNS